jgi:hypothetical protein
MKFLSESINQGFKSRGLRHSGLRGVADEAVNTVHKKDELAVHTAKKIAKNTDAKMHEVTGKML